MKSVIVVIMVVVIATTIAGGVVVPVADAIGKINAALDMRR